MSYVTELTAEHKKFLSDLLGEEAIFDPAALKAYSSDASLTKGIALAAARPRNVEQVQALMRFCYENNIVVHPRGRGTSLSGGAAPTVPGIVVSLLGMDKIIEISDTDFVAEVEAGACTATFQAEVSKRGLFYPPDPASGKASTLGGNVITCAGGLRAVRYGVTRDYVLGCELVTADGTLLKLGGRMHKDVIGLDLLRLVVGSEGTLGILTKLILKLLPKPEASASLLAGYASVDEAAASMGRVFAAGILPCAVEIMNSTVVDVLKKTGECPWPDSVRALLLFQVDGSKDTVPMEIERLSRQLGQVIWQKNGVGAEEEALWAFRRRVTSSAYILGPDRIGGDMAVPRGKIPEAIRRFEEIAAKNGKIILAYGHAGDGNIHANVHYDISDPDDKARTIKTHHELDEAVLDMSGSVSGEHGGGSLKDVGLQLGKAEHAMMRAVRKVFDPKGILNPGKGY